MKFSRNQGFREGPENNQKIGYERFESVRGECVSVKHSIGTPSMLRLIRSVGDLHEDVVDLRFEMGVQSSVEVVEEIQVCCRKLDL